MTTLPTAMQFGSAEVISPDGSDRVPPNLWPELAALVLLEPEPELRRAWVERLEVDLGVRDVHRAYIAGGLDALRGYIRADREARGMIIDDFSRIDRALPFPGEGPAPSGHALTTLPDDDDQEGVLRRRLDTIRPEDDRLAWFVARAATRQENRAEKNLIAAGFAVYVPRLTRWRRMSRFRARMEQPLFGGYFFVGIGAGQALGDVVDTDGVHDLVRCDRVPRQVAFPPIADLVRDELDGEFDRTRRDKRKDPEPGSPVTLTGGMFAGWPARFVERRDDERISLMLTMFGRETAYAADPEDVALPEAKGDV